MTDIDTRPNGSRAGANAETSGAPLVERILRPFQQFVATEAAGGIVLLACAVAALVWANSSRGDAYFHLWERTLTVGFAGFALTKSLHHWINDGLMVVFFLLVGLEIKREIFVGELSSLKQAVLPIAAAVGGMIVPATIYAAFNIGGPGARGWGIPMATDIAFALGVLALLGDRIPTGLRVFLAALAIVDDLGAVLVIALFYTAGISGTALIAAGLVFTILVICNLAGVRHPMIYAALGVALWLAVLNSGVHATIAGVLLAVAIPSRTMINEDTFVLRAEAALFEFRTASIPNAATVLSNPRQQEALHTLERVVEAVQSPLLRIEHSLHKPVAFGIMPLFAFANAGVRFDAAVFASLSWRIVLGVAMGLVAGKTIGIFLTARAAVASGAAVLPANVGWRRIFGVSWLGGIGFTMSLFVATLAFGPGALLDSAKLGILGASLVAGVAGGTLLGRMPRGASANDL
ncbi:MAG TPA: Na+/H+ antiporter NhaA [Gemmatimonadaceae bacterium]